MGAPATRSEDGHALVSQGSARAALDANARGGKPDGAPFQDDFQITDPASLAFKTGA
jgi:hypothetical protein